MSGVRQGELKSENNSVVEDPQVIKLKNKVRSLKRSNESLSRKLNNVVKGNEELSREREALEGSLSKMGAAEQQLVQELLTKVQEKDMLKCELARISREKDELELLVQSMGAKMRKELEVDHHLEARDPSGQYNNSMSSGQSDYEEELPLPDPIHSGNDETDTIGSVCQRLHPTDEPLMSMSIPVETHSSKIKRKCEAKAFRGRGSIQFYSALDEAFGS